MFKLSKYKTAVYTIIATMAIGFMVESNNYIFNANIIILLSLFAMYFLFKNTVLLEKKEKFWLNFVVVLFSFFIGIYYFYNLTYLTKYHNRTYFYFAQIIVFIGSFLIVRQVIYYIYHKIRDLKVSTDQYEVKRKNKKVFFLSFIFITLCWGFYYLLYFPANVIRDDLYQITQYIGFFKLTTHHPVIHTMLLGKLYELGIAMFGDERGGMALYTAVQLLCMSFSVAYLVATMYTTGFKKKFVWLVLLFNALFPVLGVLAVTPCKDAIEHMGIIMVMCIMFRLIVRREKQEESVPWYKRDFFDDTFFEYVGLFVFGLITALFRTNGIYVMFFFLLFSLMYIKKVPLAVVILVLVMPVALYIRGPVYKNVWHATTENNGETDVVEMLSLPIKQVAAVVAHGKDVHEDEKELIQKVSQVDYSKIKAMYFENIFSDSLKDNIRGKHENEKYLTDHYKEYIKLWIDLGLRNPGVYIREWVNLTAGFWAPNSNAYAYYNDGFDTYLLDQLPDITIFGIQNENRIKRVLVIYEKIGLIGLIFSQALQMWIVLFGLAIVFIKKKYKFIPIYIPLLVIWGILLVASPMWRDCKYLQPVSSVFIFLFLLPFYKKPAEPALAETVPDESAEELADKEAEVVETTDVPEVSTPVEAEELTPEEVSADEAETEE